MSEMQTHANRAHTQMSVQASADKRAQQRAHAGVGAGAGSRAAHLATFQLLYESRDGRMCLFQDEQGHLTCVRADRLAH